MTLAYLIRKGMYWQDHREVRGSQRGQRITKRSEDHREVRESVCNLGNPVQNTDIYQGRQSTAMVAAQDVLLELCSGHTSYGSTTAYHCMGGPNPFFKLRI